MHKTAIILTLPLMLALNACGASESDTDNAADDFAARINGENAASAPLPEATATPTIAEPLPGAAAGAFAPGTATDPESATCAANAMGPFIGQPADDPTRAAIMNAAAGAREVRFIPAGSAYIKPDPTSPRLNIMIDNIGVIRDARCG